MTEQQIMKAWRGRNAKFIPKETWHWLRFKKLLEHDRCRAALDAAVGNGSVTTIHGMMELVAGAGLIDQTRLAGQDYNDWSGVYTFFEDWVRLFRAGVTIDHFGPKGLGLMVTGFDGNVEDLALLLAPSLILCRVHNHVFAKLAADGYPSLFGNCFIIIGLGALLNHSGHSQFKFALKKDVDKRRRAHMYLRVDKGGDGVLCGEEILVDYGGEQENLSSPTVKKLDGDDDGDDDDDEDDDDGSF